MYGLINDAIRRLVVEENGEDVWHRIVERSGTSHLRFAALHYYDDADTFALVFAAAEVLDASPDDLLRSFGRYWSTRVAPESYPEYLPLGGLDLWDVLVGLDAMHTRIQTLFPKLRPPSIDVERAGDVIVVHYRSERTGLAAFTTGLLEGLVELCDLEADVQHTIVRGESGDHDVFEIAI